MVDLAWARGSPGRSRFQKAAAGAAQASRDQWGGAAKVKGRGTITGFRHASLPACFAQFP